MSIRSCLCVQDVEHLHCPTNHLPPLCPQSLCHPQSWQWLRCFCSQRLTCVWRSDKWMGLCAWRFPLTPRPWKVTMSLLSPVIVQSVLHVMNVTQFVYPQQAMDIRFPAWDWTFTYRLFKNGYRYLFLLGKYLGVELLGHMMSMFPFT